MNYSKTEKQLHFLAIAEGISYLLFALTMPLKYMFEMPLPNKIVGMAHGILFILYCLWVILVYNEKKWSFWCQQTKKISQWQKVTCGDGQLQRRRDAKVQADQVWRKRRLNCWKAKERRIKAHENETQVLQS